MRRENDQEVMGCRIVVEPSRPGGGGRVSFGFCLKGISHPKNNCGKYDRATPEKFFGVLLAYIQSLEGFQKAD